MSILYEGVESLGEDPLREVAKGSHFPQCTTGGQVVIPLPRFYPSDLESLGDTHSQSPKPLSSNPNHSCYSSWEPTIISGKLYSVGDVSKFHFQLASTYILQLIIPEEGTQKKHDSWFAKNFTSFPVPLSFSQAFVFSALDYLKLCQGAIYFLIEMWGCFHRWKLRG